MELVTLKEASKSIGIPYETVWYHFKHGRIATVKVGKYQLIDPEALRRVLNSLGYRQRKTTRQVH